jgi:transcription termination/antitermination protein NusG
MWELGKTAITRTFLSKKHAQSKWERIRQRPLLTMGPRGRSYIDHKGSPQSVMLHDCPAASWYALQTRSRHEKLVRDRLAGRGFEPLLPLSRRLSQWSDRKIWIDAPLFSGFCFARFSLHDQLAVLTLPGVVRIVGCNGPEAIPDDEMVSLQKLAVSGLDCEPQQYCEEGMLVEVIGGPLAGVRGTLIRKAGRDHVVLRVRLIQQSASVQVVRGNVRPVSNSHNLPPEKSLVSA